VTSTVAAIVDLLIMTDPPYKVEARAFCCPMRRR
jgi:hypothetical protein